jgi:poly-gamma-glutamate synthesis protein (capsule biosynthesis protein)
LVAVSPPPPPTVAVGGTYKIAIPASLVADLSAPLAALTSEYPKLKLNVVTVDDSDNLTHAGADLGVYLRLPGAPAKDHGTTVRRLPIAIGIPLTLTPDDLTRAQAVDVISGTIGDWSQVGSQPRPVRLAIADPANVASVGNLVGRPDLKPTSARGGAAEALFGETDAGTDETIVGPWSGPRRGTKAVRIDGLLPDDPGYPLATETVLFPLKKDAAVLSDQIGAALLSKLSAPRPGTVTIDATGDLMLGRGVASMVQKHGTDWLLAGVADRLKTSQIRFGNLEFALTDRGAPAHKDFTFRAPPSAADSLVGAGFNVVSVANNHIMDYGGQGLADTLAVLERQGIGHTGAGLEEGGARSPLLVTVNGLRIAWLAYLNVPNDGVTGFVARSIEAGPGRPGVAWGTPEAVRRDVAEARKVADLVVVALHSGFEFTSEPNSVQRDLAHAAIDAGAALVLGAHPHVLQGLEYYHGGLIAYSLGNFVFDLDESDLAHVGLPSVLTVILRVTLDAKGVTGVEVYPATINPTTFRPEPVIGDQARPVYDRFFRLTDALNGRPRTAPAAATP